MTPKLEKVFMRLAIGESSSKTGLSLAKAREVRCTKQYIQNQQFSEMVGIGCLNSFYDIESEI